MNTPEEKIFGELCKNGGGDAQAITEYLAAGADPNATDECDDSYLMHAASKGRADLVSLFLENGTKTTLQDNNDRTALIKAVAWNQLECARLLLAHHPEKQVNLTDEYGANALMRALMRSSSEQQEFAQLLIDAGTNLAHLDIEGRGVLDYKDEKETWLAEMIAAKKHGSAQSVSDAALSISQKIKPARFKPKAGLR